MSKTFEQLEPVISALDKRIKTNLDAYPTDTADGEIASFSDGADNVPVKSLVVGIEPLQDLHGYENPWPAGGGKNLLPAANAQTVTYNGMTFTSDGAGRYVINGESTTTSYYNFPIETSITFPENATLYVHLRNDMASGTIAVAFLNDGVQLGSLSLASLNRITEAAFLKGATVNMVRLYVNGAQTLNNVHCSPMVLLTDTPTDFEPYSNICPITGFTGAKIEKRGKNLLDYKTYGRPLPYTTAGVTFSENADGSIHASGTAASAAYLNVSLTAIPFRDKVLTFSTNSQNVLPSLPSYIDENGASHHMASGTPVPSDAISLSYSAYVPKGATIDEDFCLQLELDSTATAYEPYQGETFDITFPTEAGTVYGGSLDVTNGVLTVDRRIKTLERTDTFVRTEADTYYQFTYYSTTSVYKNGGSALTLCNRFPKIALSERGTVTGLVSYSTDNGYRFAITASMGITTDQEWKDYIAANPVEIELYLITPITYQLTPTEVKSLLGQNNIWADIGNTNVEYRADTSAYITKKIAEAISALS